MNPYRGGFNPKKKVSSTFKYTKDANEKRSSRGYYFSPGLFGFVVLILLMITLLGLVFLYAFSDLFDDSPSPSDYRSITYETNNGLDPINEQFLKDGSFYLTDMIPEKAGYHFDGWYLDEELTRKVTPNELNIVGITHSMTLYAKWRVYNPSVEIVFDTQGGNPMDSVTLSSGTSLSSYVPTKPNTVFYGWYTDLNYKEPVLTVPSENATLYALWLNADLTKIGSSDVFYRMPFGRQFKTLQGGYYLSDTEVTYGLWNTIYEYAISNGFVFMNIGTPANSLTHDEVNSNNELLPVVNISPLDTIIWLNAYSMYLGLQPVYYFNNNPLKTANVSASTIDVRQVNGMRLPTNLEWEFASRYTQEASPNLSAIDRDNYYLFSQTHSGMTSMYSDTGDEVRWYVGNSNNMAHPVGLKEANTLGLFDMSGNVTEFILTYQTMAFYGRGDNYLTNGSIGSIEYPAATSKNGHTGFRIAFGYVNFMTEV